MDGERFDEIARRLVGGSRRRVVIGFLGSVLAVFPLRSGARRERRKDTRGRDARTRQRGRDRARNEADRASDSVVRDEACGATGAACVSDAGCCAGICQRFGACTRRRKRGKRKKTVLTGACRCAERECIPDNIAACSGKQCGAAVNNCRATVSCGGCGAGQTCQDNTCVCAPDNAAACSGKQCGNVVNNCGATVSCGTCGAGTTCQGGSCVCVPNNAACSGKQCGNAVNNCGATVSCGTCGPGTTCQNGSCACQPNNAAACSGKQCGNVVNNCGATISCGTCANGSTCQGGACVCVPSCTGKQCGDNGCGGFCGTCTNGKTCQSGTCACPRVCCPRRHNTVNCQCIDKGPVTLSVRPNSASVAKGATIDVTVRLEMFEDSHLPSIVRTTLLFDAAVLEPVSITRTSRTASWTILSGPHFQSGFAGIAIAAPLGFDGILQQSADVLIYRFRAIGNSGASTALTFSTPLVASVSECDQAAENILDSVVNGTINVS